MLNASRNIRFRKASLTFLVAGVLGGLAFAWVTSLSDTNKLWFLTIEWWVLPTFRFWLLAGAVFFVSVGASYMITVSLGWLKKPTTMSRIFAAVALGAGLPLVLDVFSKPRFVLLGLVIRPLMVGVFLSLALWVATSRWFKLLSVLMLISYVGAPFLASIPNLLESQRPDFEDALTSFIRLTLLIWLSGWWLARATALEHKVN